MMSDIFRKAALATTLALGMGGMAQAATVNDVVDFNGGSSTGGNIKTYTEDGYQFYDARIVGGPCEVSGSDKCAALNKNETTVLTRVDGGAFDLSSIWFYLAGVAKEGSNALAIFDTNNILHRFDFTQPTYTHNTGYTEALDFIGVTSITFSSGATDACTTDSKGKTKCEKNQGNARFDTLKLSYTTIDPPPPVGVPLPAGLPLLLAGLGALALVRRRKA